MDQGGVNGMDRQGQIQDLCHSRANRMLLGCMWAVDYSLTTKAERGLVWDIEGQLWCFILELEQEVVPVVSPEKSCYLLMVRRLPLAKRAPRTSPPAFLPGFGVVKNNNNNNNTINLKIYLALLNDLWIWQHPI